MHAGPLVSCITPTRSRRAFLPRAIELFLAQDYDARELVILDDGDDPVRDCVPDDPRIRYLRADAVQSVGAKRNALCREAGGEIIVHWDDDDWYPAWRVRKQVEALSRPGAAVSGSSTQYFYEPSTGRAWRYQYWGKAPFLTGATLAYWKLTWKDCPFEDVQEGEDTRFVRAIARHKVVDLGLPSLCVGTVHHGNASPKLPAAPGWIPVRLAGIRALLDAPPSAPPPPTPLTASCIMPTANRRRFVAMALELFLGQKDVDAELVVVDSGDERVQDLCSGLAQVRYVPTVPGATIGAQRNLACDFASGDVIAHWDDDDWYGPDRLLRQLEPIAAGRAEITGLENRYTLNLEDGVCWTTSDALHRRMFVGDVHGGTLAYRRSLRHHGLKYLEVNIAEDARLLADMVRLGARLERVANEGSFVYIRHGSNAWSFDAGDFLDPDGWSPTAPPAAMAPSVIDRYRGLIGAGPIAPPDDGRQRGLDCLGSTLVVVPDRTIEAERCVAFVATDSYADLLGGALESLDRFGGLSGVPRVVFVEERGSACEAVARRHGAHVVSCLPLRGRTPAVKGALYSMSRFVRAKQYLCLDADVLVVDGLSTLFELHARLPEGRVLIAPEATRGHVPTLSDALVGLYRSTRGELDALIREYPRIAREPHVVNDGVFVADAAALQAVDDLLGASATLQSWARARPDVWWRPKGALNVALSQLGAIAPLDGSYNVQLHIEIARRGSSNGDRATLWRGRRATVLHFNGGARATYRQWRRDVLAG